MQTQLQSNIPESPLKVSFRNNPSNILLHKFSKEMTTLLKLIRMNGELISQAQTNPVRPNRFSLNLDRTIDEAQNLLHRFSSLQENSEESKMEIHSDPQMILKEVADVCGLKIRVVIQKNSTHLIKASHEMLIDTLVALMDQTANKDNTLLGACIYDKAGYTCLKFSFQNDLSEKLESSVGLHYVLKSVSKMNGFYERESDAITIKFKRLEI